MPHLIKTQQQKISIWYPDRIQPVHAIQGDILVQTDAHTLHVSGGTPGTHVIQFCQDPNLGGIQELQVIVKE